MALTVAVTRCENAYLFENKGLALAPVTSEVAGSSPVVPATPLFFKQFEICLCESFSARAANAQVYGDFYDEFQSPSRRGSARAYQIEAASVGCSVDFSPLLEGEARARDADAGAD